MRHTFTLARAVLVALIACSALGEANAASRLEHRPYVERTGSYWRHYGYPRPNLHLRDKRVSEALALPTLATQHEVLSLS